ncbi:MAG: GFA family protein [Dongiaceae bacterium]
MLTGRCQCGGVRYQVDGEPIALYACHCLECRKQSASAFGLSLIVHSADFRLTQGIPASWVRAADSGRHLRCWFCPDCGSRLWHDSEPASETMSIKGGSLDRPVDFSTATHIWTDRALPGFKIPAGAQHYPGEPPD